MKTTLNYVISTILTTVVYYLGGMDTAMKTLLILMVLALMEMIYFLKQ